MKTSIVRLLAVFALLPVFSTAFAQGTAFTYQGRLNNGANPVGGNYDLRFTVYDAVSSGAAVAGPLTNSATPVTNGLFLITLDFGSGVFTGANRWLEIAVRTNGVGAFTNLAPRQQLTATPYAVMAGGASNLLGTLPVAQLSGTIPATQLSGAVVTNNATGLDLGGAFSGSHSGNGGGLTNVNGTLQWQVVSGTTQLAQPNTGYFLTNNSLVTVTLPASPGIGSVVRVSGRGTGGWKIAQNTNQSISCANLAGNIGTIWTARDSSRSWNSVASSVDGTKLVAADSPGQIYTSTDSGVTWTARDNNRSWISASSSADGARLAAVEYGGRIYISTDSGVTWTARDSNRGWYSVASSADGTKLVAVEYGGQIYTSTDSGTNWTARDSSRNWYSVASSANGTKLVAVVENGQIYTSTDSGVTWIARDSNRSWDSIASSADGTKLVAGEYNGRIYTSTDSGTNWTARDSSRLWYSVASSSDGTRLVAVEYDGQVYISIDSGVTWTARDNNRHWVSVASSSDGTRFVAAVYFGQIYTSDPSTTTGTAGYLLGGQNTAIELQYDGNGQFLPISYVGTFQAF